MSVTVQGTSRTTRADLAAWVNEIAELTQPDRVVWCDGSEAEYERLCEQLVEQGHLHASSTRSSAPTRFYAASDPTDVARVEDRTFICSEKRGGRRPDQPLEGPRRDAGDLPASRALFRGCMRGRTMYVVPFCMGPLGSPTLRARRRDHRLRRTSPSPCAP